MNSNLVNQIGDLIKTAKLSDTNLPLKKCDLTHADYTKLGFWTGSGDKNCTNPKILNSEAPVKIEGWHFAIFFESNIVNMAPVNPTSPQKIFFLI